LLLVHNIKFYWLYFWAECGQHAKFKKSLPFTIMWLVKANILALFHFYIQFNTFMRYEI
jgi:biotin transporter BioY